MTIAQYRKLTKSIKFGWLAELKKKRGKKIHEKLMFHENMTSLRNVWDELLGKKKARRHVLFARMMLTNSFREDDIIRRVRSKHQCLQQVSRRWCHQMTLSREIATWASFRGINHPWNALPSQQQVCEDYVIKWFCHENSVSLASFLEINHSGDAMPRQHQVSRMSSGDFVMRTVPRQWASEK